MMISGSGAVGIGTNSPAGGVKLHIRGASSAPQAPMLKLVGDSTKSRI